MGENIIEFAVKRTIRKNNIKMTAHPCIGNHCAHKLWLQFALQSLHSAEKRKKLPSEKEIELE